MVPEIPRSNGNEATASSVSANSFGLPPTSAWTATSRLTEPDIKEPPVKNRLGDLEFPPLGTVLPKRPSNTSLGDKGKPASIIIYGKLIWLVKSITLCRMLVRFYINSQSMDSWSVKLATFSNEN